MKKKIWYIKIQDAEEGPFDILELRHDPRLTPDTLVRKKGSSKWVPMRSVPELKEVFEDALPLESYEERIKKGIRIEKEELLLNPPYDFPPFLFWLLIMAIVLGYVCYQLYGK